MSLINRLAGLNGEAKIGVHYFYAAMLEVHYGEFTTAQLVAHFNLDAGDESDLDTIILKYSGLPDDAAKVEYVNWLHAVFMLAEAGAPGYTTGAELASRLTRY